MKIERAKRATITFMALVILVGAITVIAGYGTEFNLLPTIIKVIPFFTPEVEPVEVIITSTDSKILVSEDGKEFEFEVPETLYYDDLNAGFNPKYNFSIVNDNDFAVKVLFNNDTFSISNTDLRIDATMYDITGTTARITHKNTYDTIGRVGDTFIIINPKSTAKIRADLSIQQHVKDKIEGGLSNLDYIQTTQNIDNYNLTAEISASFEVVQV